jgi:hypothetical protein
MIKSEVMRESDEDRHTDVVTAPGIVTIATRDVGVGFSGVGGVTTGWSGEDGVEGIGGVGGP